MDRLTDEARTSVQVVRLVEIYTVKYVGWLTPLGV